MLFSKDRLRHGIEKQDRKRLSVLGLQYWIKLQSNTQYPALNRE
jgi:hypothetical protein